MGAKGIKRAALLIPLFIGCVGLVFAAETIVPVSTSPLEAPSKVSGPSKGNGLEESEPGAEKILHNLAESKWVQSVEMERNHMEMVSGRSQVIRLTKKVGRISVSDPSILDIVILSPQEVLFNAKKEGAANVIMWDHLNEISIFDVTVTKDPELLRTILQKIAPETHFDIAAADDVFVVKAKVDTAVQKRQIEEATDGFAEGSVSLIEVEKAKQILLETRFVQVDRSQDFDFGIDLEYDRDNTNNNILQRFLPGNAGGATSGDSTYTFTNPNLQFDIFDRSDDSIYQIGVFQRDDVFLGYLNALERKGVVKTIAHPNLLAKDGEEASFLVGGEAATLISTNANVSVNYREFGTRLTFTPEIIEDDKIRLKVEPEVSNISTAFGVTATNTSVPGFSTTKVSTTVELYHGETFVIGGLVRQVLTTDDSGVPFLRRIPIFGKLFQDMNYDMDETELIVIITPYIVRPDKVPVPQDGKEDDLLSVATEFPSSPIEDQHADAILSYFKKDRKRFLTEEMDKLEQTEIPPVLDIEVDENMLDELDEMESALEKQKMPPAKKTEVIPSKKSGRR